MHGVKSQLEFGQLADPLAFVEGFPPTLIGPFANMETVLTLHKRMMMLEHPDGR